MTQERPADRLMDKLLRAIEVSLKATLASREAVQEILKRGAETGIFFSGARTAEASDGFDLTEQDRDFLRSLSIRPDLR
jgi:D-serine deaminase-like pyridoxal phosphate-dependent protein